MRFRSITRVLALALVGIVAAVWAATASGVESPPPPDNPDNPYADDRYVPREMKRQLRQRREREARRATDEAKAARHESRTKYKDRSKHEALAIARAKFDELFAMPAWTGLVLEPGQRLKHYVDDFQALVAVGDEPGETALVESTLPLLNADDEPTDLALEPRGAGFAPKAAEVPLELPGDLAHGITAGQGRLRVTPATEGATDAIESDDKVFYANALRDTDIVVMPTARGFETFHHLRSADSPEQLSFDVDAPGGSTLRLGEARGPDPEQRGIEVVSPGGKVIARISPPNAFGADRDPLRVTYSIDGDTVTMNVPHRDRDVAYPVMVDPDYQLEDFRHWRDGNRDTYGWQFGSYGNCQWHGYFGGGWWTYGHILYHNNGVWCNDGEWAEWKWQAPRMSYIYRAEFHYQNHPYRYTCVVNGLWAPWAGNWDGGWAWVHCGDLWNHGRGHCPVHNNCDWNNGQPSNVAVFKVQAQYSGPRNPGAWAELGGSAIYLRDRENPVIDAIGQQTDGRWYRGGSGWTNVYPRAHDDGLGMNKFQLYIPGVMDDYRRHPCIRSRCPGSWSLPNDGQSQFSYNIDSLPEGINTITLNARDSLDKITGATYKVNVDRDGPGLNVYGPLRDAANLGKWWGTKTLSIQSWDGVNDGNPANHRSGVTNVDIYVDGARKHQQSQSCFASCRLDFSWNFDARAYAPGTHTIRVVARDGAGNETSSSTWSVMTTHSDPGGVGDKMDSGPDDPPTEVDGMDPSTCLDPAMYCGADDAANPAEVEADAEPALGDEGGGDITAATIRKGTDGWGWADDDYPNFDRKLVQQLHEGKPKKRARVIVPWDALLVGEGVPGLPAGSDTRPLYTWKERDPAYPDDPTKSVTASSRVEINPDYLAKYDKWMERAKRYGWDVMVSFGASAAELPNYNGLPNFKLGPRVLAARTSAAEVTATTDPYSFIYNVRRLLARWRSKHGVEVTYMTAYNEPNGPSYAASGVHSFPHLRTRADEGLDRVSDAQIDTGMKYAAAYFNELRSYCSKKSCSVLAGEMVDRRDMQRYFKSYQPKLNTVPKRWAYHPYEDGMRGATGSSKFQQLWKFYLKGTGPRGGTGSTGPDIWFTEVGPLYAGSKGVNDWALGVKQLEFQMKLAAHKRVKRFYYYATRGGWAPVVKSDGTLEMDPRTNTPKNTWHDSGFIDPWREEERNPDGSYKYPNRADQIRPAYCTYLAVTRGSNGPFPRLVEGTDFTAPPGREPDRFSDGVRACP